MKKKLIGTLLLTCLSMFIVGTTVLLTHHDGFLDSSKATSYFVRLNSNNAYQGFDQTIPTSSGQYALPFTYSDASPETGYHCKLSENGTIKNSTDIQYITSVHAVWTGSDSQLYVQYSIDNSNWTTYTLLESDSETLVEDKPYFIRVKANGGEVSLSSLTIYYSCSPRKDEDLKSVKIFATNDIHGQVYPENPQEDHGKIGIGKMMTYIKENKDGNTLVLDQGDTWQGSIYSNYNYGNLINDVMTYAGYDARTIGNHDFDWGIDKLKANTSRSYQGHTLPTLAANVYDFDFINKQTGTTQQSDIGRTSVTYTLDNGLKVGIVGVIGSDQITSIDSSNTHDITFVDHVNIIKDEAVKLRNDHCDIVIASIHSGQESVIGNNLGNYVDLVLCGHSHAYEITNEGDLYYAQFGNNTSYLGEIELSVDSLGKITTSINTLTSSGIDIAVSDVDPSIQSLIDDYYDSCQTSANQVIVKDAYGAFYQSSNAVNLMCEAIYNAAISEGYDIDLAYANKARHDLGVSGQHTTWTYSDLYEAFPFDNKVYIFEVGYDEIVNEIVRWNNICKLSDRIITYKPGDKLTIACLDYLAFHTNSDRYYDYFPCIEEYDPSSMDYLEGNYREILRDYLLDNEYDKDGKTLSYSDYSSNQSRFNKHEIQEISYSVTLHLNNDNGDIKYIKARYNQLISDAVGVDPVWRAHKFEGWYKDVDLQIPFEGTEVNTDIELYAKWSSFTPKVYNLVSSSMAVVSGYNILYAESNDSESVEFGMDIHLSNYPNLSFEDYFRFECTNDNVRFTSISIYLPYEDIYFDMDYRYLTPSIIPISESLFEYKIECFTSFLSVYYYDDRVIPFTTFSVSLETTS